MKHVKFRVLLLTALASLSLALPAAAWLGDGDTTPSVAAFSKNGPVTGAIAFSPDDFQVSGKEELSSIVLETLPDPNAGALTMGDTPIPEGSEIAMSAVSGLRFTPLASPMLSATEFSFTPVFANGTSGADVSVGLFLLTQENSAPVAENLSVTTYKNVEATAAFAGTDPDGDLLTYKLVSKPARGAVTQAQEGAASFVYTPYENKTGKDAFTYVAVDPVGNTSTPATVSVKIEKQKTKVAYSDMDGVTGHREAVRMAETGLLTGAQVGNAYFFQPELPVSRATFTALVLQAAGLEDGEAVSATGFADDAAIATWAKPYVSTALRSGLVQGTQDESGQVVFQADAPVTRAEAAVMLDRALNVTDVQDAFSASAPAWCSQSVSNLESCGVLAGSEESGALGDALTRADAAVMLSNALDVIAARDESGWFHW